MHIFLSLIMSQLIGYSFPVIFKLFMIFAKDSFWSNYA